MEIRFYRPEDEESWLRCRILAFLNTAYYDNVLRAKETYDSPSIELVAIEHNQIVGLLDIEYEINERTVCSRGEGLGSMIWHVAVHPDYRRKGIASQLLCSAEKIVKSKGINRIEAWTRDDRWVNEWYEKNNFLNVESYLHVFMNDDQEMNDVIKSKVSGLYLVQAFGHYVGENAENIKQRFKRVHECLCFEKSF
ncbi:GNAT family N-acetyltransferase [Paenibacillus polymyxa]|uniref:GNAT family N-acetyltransferase n=1 Tax=Paenibacillus polymyxa TaxID=1406 RepID=UPI002ED28E31|nr:GNAT family N-acetyltransferase [Paenibacillus polymyxa]